VRAEPEWNEAGVSGAIGANAGGENELSPGQRRLAWRTVAMRHLYSPQPDLNVVPIKQVVLPRKSRDELPPILAGLQWLWMHPTLKAESWRCSRPGCWRASRHRPHGHEALADPSLGYGASSNPR
jgi:hypothetical protein